MSAKFDKTIIKETLYELGFSAPATRVYEYLLGVKVVSAKQIAEALSMPRPSVYDQIKELKKYGLVSELKMNNRRRWQAEPGERLLQLVKKKEAGLKEREQKLEEVLPMLKELQAPGSEPRVRFYPGKESFLPVFTDALMSRVDEILIMWPFAEMLDLIGPEQLIAFTNERETLGIKVRSIWSHEEGLKPLPLPLEETRVAPKGLSWDMGYMLYGDRVSFISSGRESFAFSVHSHDFSELMRTQFEAIWEQSKQFKKKTK